MKRWNEMSRKKQIWMIVLLVMIVLLLIGSSLANVLFPNTLLAQIIDQSIGKFFNLFGFFVDNYVRLLETFTIIFFVWLIAKGIHLLIQVMTSKSQRSQTVGALFSSIIKYGSVVVMVFLILAAWGVQTQTLLAGAGILGLALSFGAQSLIEDVISGLFLIFEKQFQVGDVIQIDSFRGTVTEIGIRATRFEDVNGDIKIVNNSDIRGAINTSAHLSLSICDVSVSYGANLKEVEQVIIEALPKIKDMIPEIQEGPTYRGVQSLGESSVVLRVVAKAQEMKKYQVTRDLNRAMKLLFDEKGISIPFPQLVVHMEKEKKED